MRNAVLVIPMAAVYAGAVAFVLWMTPAPRPFAAQWNAAPYCQCQP